SCSRTLRLTGPIRDGLKSSHTSACESSRIATSVVPVLVRRLVEHRRDRGIHRGPGLGAVVETRVAQVLQCAEPYLSARRHGGKNGLRPTVGADKDGFARLGALDELAEMGFRLVDGNDISTDPRSRVGDHEVVTRCGTGWMHAL